MKSLKLAFTPLLFLAAFPAIAQLPQNRVVCEFTEPNYAQEGPGVLPIAKTWVGIDILTDRTQSERAVVGDFVVDVSVMGRDDVSDVPDYVRFDVSVKTKEFAEIATTTWVSSQQILRAFPAPGFTGNHQIQHPVKLQNGRTELQYHCRLGTK